MKSYKTFYQDDGITYNQEGINTSLSTKNKINEIYTMLIKKGYHTCECKEMLFNTIFQATTIIDALLYEKIINKKTNKELNKIP